MKRSIILCALAMLASLMLLSGCGKARTVKTVVELGADKQTDNQAAKQEAEIAGDWYGWWKLYNTSGEWTEKEGYWYDCCISAEADGGNTALLIWSEVFPKDFHLAYMIFERRGGEYHLTGGDMLNIELKAEGARLALDDSGMLTIYGSYYGTSRDGFDYVMYLRPWGNLWEDEEKPYYYDSWYLPLIEAGEPMPDKIG